MSDAMNEQIDEHLALAQAVRATLLPGVEALAQRLHRALGGGGTLYTFGNGGSAADAEHLAAELVGRFRRERKPLRAVALGASAPALTCIGNDYAFDQVFSRQLEALARPGDLALGISTSGNSPNVVKGLEAARRAGATAVALTGNGGGAVAAAAELCLIVPSGVTARVQEMHLLLIHLLCERLDELVLA